jgi:hypothetical protein
LPTGCVAKPPLWLNSSASFRLGLQPLKKCSARQPSYGLCAGRVARQSVAGFSPREGHERQLRSLTIPRAARKERHGESKSIPGIPAATAPQPLGRGFAACGNAPGRANDGGGAHSCGPDHEPPLRLGAARRSHPIAPPGRPACPLPHLPLAGSRRTSGGSLLSSLNRPPRTGKQESGGRNKADFRATPHYPVKGTTLRPRTC